MSKNCQKYIVLLSIGLLPLFPFLVGCGGCSPEPKPKPVVAPAEPEVDRTQPAEPVVPEPTMPEIAMPEVIEPQLVVEPMLVVVPEPAAVEEPLVTAPEPVVPEPVVVEEPVVTEPAAEQTEEPSEGVRTDSPVNQTPPVNTETPLNTDSPVNTTSPVQGSRLSPSLLRLLSAALLILQEEPEAPVPPTPVPPTPAQPIPTPPTPAEPAQSAQADDLTEPTPAPPQPTVPAVVGQPPAVEPPGMGQPGMGQPGREQGQQQGRGQRGGQQFGEQPFGGQQFGGQQFGGQPGMGQPGMPPGGMQGGPPGGGGPGGRAMGGQPPMMPPPSAVQVPRDTPAGMVRIISRNQPWREIIEWVADQAALSLQADRMPTGTLNLNDNEYYTPTEALDVLNAYLQFKDYSLVRKGRTLFVLYLPDGIPPNLLETITSEELDERGKYEICRVVFNLNRVQPAVVQTEIERLLGPQGNIIPMPMSQQIVVTETGGVLRTIREIIQRMDDPDYILEGTFHTVELKSHTAEEALQTMRQLMGIDAADTALRTAVDSTGKRIYLTGRADMIRRAKELLELIDSSLAENDPRMWGEAQFETYEVGTADPATVLSVLQTLLVGTPDVRLQLDPRTNAVLLRARPAVHATVRESIKQMQLNAPQIDIIPLKRMSPLTAVERIKMVIPTAPPLSSATATATGGGGGGGGGGNRQQTASAATQLPTVEPDTLARQIIVRGTLSQIKEIRDFLASQGEDGVVTSVSVAGSRMVPISPAATALVMEQLQGILPALGPNINVIAPAPEPPPVMEPYIQQEPTTMPERHELEIPFEGLGIPIEDLIRELEGEGIRNIDFQYIRDIDDLIDSTFDRELPITQSPETPLPKSPLPKTRLHRIAEQPILAQVAASGTAPGAAGQQSDVTLMVTPVGIVVTSDDPEALAKVEELIRMLSDEMFLGELIFREYYLTHATASVVSSELQSLLNTTTPGLGVSGMASVNLPEWQQTELMGMLAASRGNAIEKTGTVTVSTNERLNSLWIQANRVDHKTIERLIKILDQPSRDDIARNPIPRSIQLRYMKAADARTLVEQAFANQMRGSGQANQRGGQQQQPQMPGGAQMQQMMQAFQAMQQGQQGRGGAAATPREQEPQMTLAVDTASNVLIVSSTESTFISVEAFVRELDERASQQKTVMVTQKLINVTPTVLQPALAGSFGPSVTFSGSTTGRTTGQQGGFGGANTMTGGMGGIGNIGGMIGGQQRQMGGGTIGGGTIGGGTFGGAAARPAGTGTIGGGTFGGAAARPAGTGAIGGGQQRVTGGTIGGR